VPPIELMPNIRYGHYMGEDRNGASSAGQSASPRQRFFDGLRLGASLAAPTFVLAATFGALARTHGWGVVAPVVCSIILFSGSAQFALLTSLAGGGGVVPAVAAAALINARFLPMGIAVAPSLRGGRLRRAFEGQAVVDASWAAAHLGAGRFDRERLIGATLPQWPAWVVGTLVGAVFAPPEHVLQAFGLDATFPTFFVVLLIDELRASSRARAAAGLGAVIAGGLVAVVPAGVALIGSTAAAFVGAREYGKKRR
jgi:4-azaleucine resistance transporter AzlC